MAPLTFFNAGKYSTSITSIIDSHCFTYEKVDEMSLLDCVRVCFAEDSIVCVCFAIFNLPTSVPVLVLWDGFYNLELW